ncbi:MAG: single-stranded-DNA-specific exonuclease RecJ [Hyphomonadaceae bacterium]|nr:single-stranded-DNA-specific exonuclease RecJ [Clostridia bacterium]
MDKKRWDILYDTQKAHAVDALQKQYGLSFLTAVVLNNRGVSDVQGFLGMSPSLYHEPLLMKDMSKAVARIKAALQNQEKITIYGDYDVDGVTATALLVRYFNAAGGQVDFYIPDRMDEGYGVNQNALDKIKARGTSLLITVDSGITAVNEAAYAKLIGLDLIITDHHECKDELPDAVAVINPKQPDCPYPFKDLCGAGVALKLIQALYEGDFEDIASEYLEIACLGTIADVVPLRGENRQIVRAGLKLIQNSERVGIRALLEVAGLTGKTISASTISFTLAPRINAAGRIGSAMHAVLLFLVEELEEALEIATYLNNENINRQGAEAEIFTQAMQKVEAGNELKKNKVLVLYDENWHHGIVGIVASRLAERFRRPTILLAQEGEHGKGSGRSVGTFNLFKALQACEAHLIKFGGHAMAAGVSIEIDNLAHFIESINDYAKEHLTREDITPSLRIDACIEASQIDLKNAVALTSLEPYGMGNPSPVFCLMGCEILELRTLSGDKHLKMRIHKDGKKFDVIGFGSGANMHQWLVGDRLDIAFSLQVNEYGGNKKEQLILKDMCLTAEHHAQLVAQEQHFHTLKKGEKIAYEDYIPDRTDLVAMYKFINKHFEQGKYHDGLFALHRRFAQETHKPMSHLKLRNILEVLRELAIWQVEVKDNTLTIVDTAKIGEKVNLEQSHYLQMLQKNRG